MPGRLRLGTCIATGCEGAKGIIGRGLCSVHYQRARLDGTLDNYPLSTPPPGIVLHSKVCGKCKRELSIDCFSLNATERYPSRRKSICKECVSPISKARTKVRLGTFAGRATDLLANAKMRSAAKGLICTLDAKWIKDKLADGCELTGFPFDLETGRSIGRFNPYSPSIDRIIPGGNYTPENCRMVIMAINVAMNAWGEELYRKIARTHFKHRRDKKEKQDTRFIETHNLLLEDSSIASIMRKH